MGRTSTRIPHCIGDSVAGVTQLVGIGRHFVGQIETGLQMFAGAPADSSTLPNRPLAGSRSGKARRRGALASAANLRPSHAESRLEFPSLALFSPSQGWLTLGIEGGENQSTEKAEVLQEVHLLLRSRRRIRLLPKPVPGVRCRDDGTDQGQSSQPPVLPDRQKDPSSDLHGAVQTDKRLGVELADPNAFAEGLTHGLCLLGFFFGIPDVLPSTDNEDGRKQRTSDSPRECHWPVSTRILRGYPLKEFW